MFTYIPNTSQTAFIGLSEAIDDHLNVEKEKRILQLSSLNDLEKIKSILHQKPRFENLIVKDDKMRTFIANDQIRGGLVSHVYDVTYGLVKNDVDTLVVLDDSIVRGTTLKESIIRILNTLHPKKIVIVSSAPQIRYPDCYGIDMSQLSKFVAFSAMVELLYDTNQDHLLEDIYIPVSVIFQSLEGLRKSCPHHTGDWYFSGDYPTPGGNKVVNIAFINFMEKLDVRAY